MTNMKLASVHLPRSSDAIVIRHTKKNDELCCNYDCASLWLLNGFTYRVFLLSYLDQCQGYAKIGLPSSLISTFQGASLRDFLQVSKHPIEKVALWEDFHLIL